MTLKEYDIGLSELLDSVRKEERQHLRKEVLDAVDRWNQGKLHLEGLKKELRKVFE